jgi:serine/threonine protein kinase
VRDFFGYFSILILLSSLIFVLIVLEVFLYSRNLKSNLSLFGSVTDWALSLLDAVPNQRLYAAPECLEHRLIGCASDIYSLGVCCGRLMRHDPRLAAFDPPRSARSENCSTTRSSRSALPSRLLRKIEALRNEFESRPISFAASSRSAAACGTSTGHV